MTVAHNHQSVRWHTRFIGEKVSLSESFFQREVKFGSVANDSADRPSAQVPTSALPQDELFGLALHPLRQSNSSGSDLLIGSAEAAACEVSLR